jgi:cystathionine beta-lyase/cystathionine gamma-synthase
MTDDYICTHLGDDQYEYFGSVVPPISQNSLHVFPTIEDMQRFNGKDDRIYTYGRALNPTVDIVQKKIAALERGEKAALFGSGMAAISSAMLTFLGSGDHFIGVRKMYGPAYRFVSEYLAKFRVESTFVEGEEIGDFEAAIRPNTKAIYLESPSSMFFTLQDIRAVTSLARKHGIRTIIDNTWSTPIYQKPLELGVDLVVHSVSKYLAGHSDVISGVVVGSAELIEKINGNERELLGGIPGPFDAWLIMRGLRTLPVRMKQHQENAMKVAGFLESHPRIEKVNYPGLPSFPQYELGKSQMKGYSGLLSFSLDCEDEGIRKFINALENFKIGVSWGGFESLVAKGSGKTVRIAVGLEDADDLIRDLDRALGAI